jgi:hypothetical protein
MVGPLPSQGQASPPTMTAKRERGFTASKLAVGFA